MKLTMNDFMNHVQRLVDNPIRGRTTSISDAERGEIYLMFQSLSQDDKVSTARAYRGFAQAAPDFLAVYEALFGDVTE
jgi:hypothetical protein